MLWPRATGKVAAAANSRREAARRGTARCIASAGCRMVNATLTVGIEEEEEEERSRERLCGVRGRRGTEIIRSKKQRRRSSSCTETRVKSLVTKRKTGVSHVLLYNGCVGESPSSFNEIAAACSQNKIQLD